MGDIAIRVENVRKRYRITAGPKVHVGTKTLRDALSWRAELLAKRLRQKLTGQAGAPAMTTHEFWALDGVSFEIQAGDVVGIIGRNGAGKSTLLKILSRITEPTEGRVELHGRVSSLLEVGTGFHPELSGRENTYLNGAILGMRKTEIDRKFDEIVAFAEIEKFIDTPVKRYSSGMYVRLAFAVAAHLEPEILLVDEVLAVGDAAFQQKCLGKMDEVARGGRTVLFVSHSMASIVSLCRSALLLNQGTLVASGAVGPVVSNYVSGYAHQSEYVAPAPTQPYKLHIERLSLRKGDAVSTAFNSSEPLLLYVDFSVTERLTGVEMSFDFCNEIGDCVFASTNQDAPGRRDNVLEPGAYTYVCQVPLQLIRSGKYHIRVLASLPGEEILDAPSQLLVFDVTDDCSPVFTLGQTQRGGAFIPVLDWTLERR